VLARASRAEMPHADDTLDLSALEAHATTTIEGEPLLHGWEPIDVAKVLGADYVPPKPEIGRRNDGRALFYAERINALIGESGSGKSWISQWAIAQVLAAGRCAIVVDLEDHVGSYVARLRGLGVDDDAIRDRLVYISPERSFNEMAGTWLDELVASRDVGLAVIDSTGEAMALDGAKPNDDDDTARWFRRLPRRISRLGPAVLLLDHLPKATDGPTGFAIGSQRKRAAIDGAMYRVEVGVAPAKGKEGHLKLVCAKDRSGYYQHGAKVADVTVSDIYGGRTSPWRPRERRSTHDPDGAGEPLPRGAGPHEPAPDRGRGEREDPRHPQGHRRPGGRGVDRPGDQERARGRLSAHLVEAVSGSRGGRNQPRRANRAPRARTAPPG